MVRVGEEGDNKVCNLVWLSVQAITTPLVQNIFDSKSTTANH